MNNRDRDIIDKYGGRIFRIYATVRSNESVRGDSNNKSSISITVWGEYSRMSMRGVLSRGDNDK